MNDKIHIRRAGRADGRTVFEIFDLAAVKSFDSLYIAEDDAGATLGAQWLTARNSTDARIATAIKSGPHELKVGTLLLERTLRSANGLARVFAIFPSENEGARIYYQSHGFELSGVHGDRITMVFRF